MALELLRPVRWLSFAASLALAVAAPGCAADSSSDPAAEGTETGTNEDEEFDANVDAITDVSHTAVKRQSIGNCWLYATSSWLEALHKGVEGEELNTSETYLTYWDWFEKIANGEAAGELATGGTYSTAAELISRYGVMLEADFIPAEASAESSSAQSKALSYINESIKSGALKTSSARKNRSLVRRELNAAFGLSTEMVAELEKVFGKSTSRTIDKYYAKKKFPTGVKVLRAEDLKVQLKDTASGAMVTKTLKDAIGVKGSWWNERTGTFAWQEVNYPTSASGRRDFMKRVQRALHDKQPVIISWFVDFNALTSDAKFSRDRLTQYGPGRQGGHMTVLEDYQASNVPGFGTLKVGEPATAEQMKAALATEAKIDLLRIKNSWGAYRPDRWSEAAVPGYHDLMSDYLNGPVKKCEENATGGTDPNNCEDDYTPLWDVVLPQGY